MSLSVSVLCLFLLLFLSVVSVSASVVSEDLDANIAAALTRIKELRTDADTLITLATKGAFKGVTYNRLANFTDHLGSRLCGSEALEDAVNTSVSALTAEGFDNVHRERVMLPNWERGREWATMIRGRNRPYTMQILGLGNSVGTAGQILSADVLVVRSFDELANMSSQAKGKIVVYNQYCDWVAQPIGCYGISVTYRSNGADTASKYGAVAALVRSVTGYSLYTPHTGVMSYGSNPKIPAACITIEDAELMQRFSDRGEAMTLQLYMEAQSYPQTVGHNVIAELTGTVNPEQVVLVSGHLDSWDVGSGVMDDGGGAFISWSALSLIRLAGLTTKKTVRLVLWSCEEFGGIGAQQYFNDHQSEVKNMDIVFESDLGVFQPLGLELTANENSTFIVKQIGYLLSSINTSAVVPGGEGTDISPWMNAGVPGASLYNEDQSVNNNTYATAVQATISREWAANT